MGRTAWLARVLAVGACAAASACGGDARHAARGDEEPDGGGGATPAASAGTSSLPSAGSAGAPGAWASGGTSSPGGSTGSGGVESGGTAGWAAAVPEQNEQETEIVSALATDDEALDAATGDDLIALTRALGAARGYLMCRCAFTPAAPPEDVAQLMQTCGVDETATRMLATDAQAVCIGQRMGQVSGMEEYLRCLAKRARALAWFEASICWTRMRPEVNSVPECNAPAGADLLGHVCQQTVLCADGSLVDGYLCDDEGQCPDLSDERDCYEYRGHDQLDCGDQLVSPVYFCEDEFSSCDTIEPPICDLSRPGRFLCGDGSEVSSQSVCDRVSDCPNDRDENLCLR
jgi:hypothetical protein